MAIRSALFAAVLAVGCNAASAGDIAGRYRIEGTSTTGAAYKGVAEIAMTTANTCRITFSDGFAGICMVKDTTFAVAYIVHGKAGLTVYEICSDGSLQGFNIDDYHNGGIGKEMLTPVR